MRPYEVMVIFDAATEPPAIQAVVDRLLETIRATDGAPGHVDRWGRRPFAYEVKHRREGYYVLVELSGAPKTVAEVDRLLSLADEVLRFKIVRLPEKVANRAAAGGSSQTRPSGRVAGSRPGRSGAPTRPEAAAAATAAAAGGVPGEDPQGAARAPGGDDEEANRSPEITPQVAVADGAVPAEG